MATMKPTTNGVAKGKIIELFPQPGAVAARGSDPVETVEMHMRAEMPVISVPDNVEYSANINHLHTHALELAKQARSLEASGNQEAAIVAARGAMQSESWAAGLLAGNKDSEPHRALLFLSAARMAFNCGEVYQARLLAMSGLITHPPAELAEQLNEIVQLIESSDKAVITAAALSSRSSSTRTQQAHGEVPRKRWHWGR